MNKKLFILASVLMAVITQVTARETYNFNSDWRIDQQKKTVTLPPDCPRTPIFRGIPACS